MGLVAEIGATAGEGRKPGKKAHSLWSRLLECLTTFPNVLHQNGNHLQKEGKLCINYNLVPSDSPLTSADMELGLVTLFCNTQLTTIMLHTQV